MELLTDPDCAPESAKSVLTSKTTHMRVTEVINLSENPSTVSSMVLLYWLNVPIPHE